MSLWSLRSASIPRTVPSTERSRQKVHQLASKGTASECQLRYDTGMKSDGDPTGDKSIAGMQAAIIGTLQASAGADADASATPTTWRAADKQDKSAFDAERLNVVKATDTFMAGKLHVGEATLRGQFNGLSQSVGLMERNARDEMGSIQDEGNQFKLEKKAKEASLLYADKTAYTKAKTLQSKRKAIVSRLARSGKDMSKFKMANATLRSQKLLLDTQVNADLSARGLEYKIGRRMESPFNTADELNISLNQLDGKYDARAHDQSSAKKDLTLS